MRSARSTAPLQAAQVMPCTDSSTRRVRGADLPKRSPQARPKAVETHKDLQIESTSIGDEHHIHQNELDELLET